MWRPPAPKPVGKLPKIVHVRQVTLALESRKALRPFQLARNAGKSNVKEVVKSKEFSGKHSTSSATIPQELMVSDCGWRAGPLRDPQRPAFTGKPRGIADKFSA
jgi:hypothetical protein